MLKSNYSVDGTAVKDLSRGSNKRVIKVCDSCGIERSTSYHDYLNTKREGKDYCHPCTQQLLMSGDKNPAKRDDVRKKIGKSLAGRKIPQNSGANNHNRKTAFKARVDARGYVVANDLETGAEMLHRKVAKEKLGRELLSSEQVHHVDGDKKNNSPNNIAICASNKEHSKIHGQLQDIAFELVQAGLIGFDPVNKKYCISSELSVKTMPVSLGFEDVILEQADNKCSSRSEVDISSEVIRGVSLEVPFIASNMSTVTSPEFCIKLRSLGALGVLHRAAPDEWIIEGTKKIANECDWVAVSIGVKDDQFDLCKKLVRAGANIVFIDVAHGYSPAVMELGEKIKNHFKEVKVVLGNTINPDMLYNIYKYADGLKIGLGSGLACTTKNTTGVHSKQFNAVYKFKKISKDFGIPIISDGGIREPSHMVKALAAGANSVMMGGVFAACPESAAPLVEGKKLYAGMSSEWVQNRWRGGLKPGTCAEGRVVMLDVGTPVERIIQEYAGALKSSITYVGAKNFSEFQDKAKFVCVRGGYNEGETSWWSPPTGVEK